MADIQGCLRGEKRAWDAFVAHAAPIVFAAVQRTLRTHASRAEPGLAEDMAQEVFLRLVKDDCRLLARYDPARASLATWLTLVARSTTIDHLRRRRVPTVPLAQVPKQATDDPGAGRAEGIDLPRELLSPRQRLVLRLLYDRELSVQEAAEVLGVEPQTVRSTKHKAIAKLRRALRDGENSRQPRG